MGSYKHLTRDDRKHIEKWRDESISIAQIASRLAVHRTTIDRELNRVPEDLLYDASHSHEDAVSKRQASGAKSKWFPELAYQIECDLSDTWSPEQIAGARGVMAFKTIYNWLDAGLLNLSTKCLRYKGHGRQKQAEKRGEMIVGHTIDQRPAMIKQRQTFGHWELDTIISGRGTSKACEATFLERKTRFYWTVPMADRTADSMSVAIKSFVALIGGTKAFLSATVDRGKEFSCWKTIEEDLGIPMYFCDAYSPWQRGSNENGNGLYREFFPKGTDFSKVTRSERLDALRKINGRPKKTLGWKICLDEFLTERLQLI